MERLVNTGASMPMLAVIIVKELKIMQLVSKLSLIKITLSVVTQTFRRIEGLLI
jgi:uncharacterized spore protein YtfJ